MNSLAHQFAAWCRSKPAEEEYDFHNSEACAFYQFAVAHDIPDPARYYSDLLQPCLPAELRDPLLTEPWTFGALADRVERQIAEQVAS
jgi:hypothetical protein